MAEHGFTIDDKPRVFDVGAVAFDLDGTLLDTVHDLAASVNALLAELGYPALAKETIRAMIGSGVRDLVSRALGRAMGVPAAALDEALLSDALERYQRLYAAQLGRETRAFPGMVQALDRLAAMRIPLAVVTNKASRFVHPHLAQAGIGDYFVVVVGGDDLPTKKPHPGPLLYAARAFGIAPARLLMVGDSGNDVDAARAAGCPVLVVPYGYNGNRSVQSLDADGIVDSLLAVADRVRYVAAPTP